MGQTTADNSICMVAILRDELPFVYEWILYHRMLGIDHFFLYDDDPDLPLADYLKPLSDYVTVVAWHGQNKHLPGRNRQTKAYWHAAQNFLAPYQWVSFLDGDEFIVLREHENIGDFLATFPDVSAVSLNWHVFGHNGFYNDPPGLITAQLTRRMFLPNRNIKTITRCDAIESITSSHSCRLKHGSWVDANHRPIADEVYPGKTAVAHINHYQCRSFTRWMKRVERGTPSMSDDLPTAAEDDWRVDTEACLRKFVTTVALNKNEYVDEYMLKYKEALEKEMEKRS
jgi:hypothetical protein